MAGKQDAEAARESALRTLFVVTLDEVAKEEELSLSRRDKQAIVDQLLDSAGAAVLMSVDAFVEVALDHERGDED